MSFVSLVKLALAEFPAIRAWRMGRRFPGLTAHHSVRFAIDGEFAYGAGVGVGEHSVVVVESGGRLAIGDRCVLGRAVEIGGRGTITIGADTSIQDRGILLGDLEIGRYCRIAPNCYCSSGTHSWSRDPAVLIMDQDEAQRARPAAEISRRVVIEDDCWIGINVVLMPGVVVGKGCVVGANAVVTRSLPPYSVAAGVPARVIRQRLDYRPPSALDAARAEDAPYFHRGFALSARERAGTPGRLATTGAFVLAMSSSVPAAALEITASRGSGPAAWIAHGGRSLPLAAEPRVLAFPAVADADGRYHGTVLDAAGAPAAAFVHGARLV